MNKDFKKEDSEIPLQEEQQVLTLVKRLQQQIISLEKKVDTLLARSAQRPNEGRDFSKPFRSFGPSQHKRKGWRNKERSGERDFSAGRFDRPRGEEGRGFEKRERPFYRSDRQQGEEGRGFEKRERPLYRSDRQQGEEKRGFGKKEKPFYRFDKPRGDSRRPGQRNKPPFRRRRVQS